MCLMLVKIKAGPEHQENYFSLLPSCEAVFSCNLNTKQRETGICASARAF